MITTQDVRAILRYLKLLTVVVFVSMAIMTTAAVYSFRSSQNAADNSKTNTRTLTLVEQCVVKGQCGPQTGQPDPGTTKLVNYLVDALGCVLLVAPSARTQADIQRCKMEAAPK